MTRNTSSVVCVNSAVFDYAEFIRMQGETISEVVPDQPTERTNEKTTTINWIPPWYHDI